MKNWFTCIVNELNLHNITYTIRCDVLTAIVFLVFQSSVPGIDPIDFD